MEVVFERERETKNKVRFSEVTPAGSDTPAIGKLYVDKGVDEELGHPKHLTVTLSAVKA